MTRINQPNSFEFFSDSRVKQPAPGTAPFKLALETIDFLKVQLTSEEKLGIQGKMEVSLKRAVCRELDAFVFDPIAKAYLCTTCCCSK